MNILWLRKIVNRLIPKNKNYVYALPHFNGKTDKMDIANYSGDNLLTILNYWGYSSFKKEYTVFVEVYDSNRLDTFKEHVSAFTNKNVCFVPVKSELMFNKKSQRVLHKFLNFLCRYRCTIWMSDAQHNNFYEKLNCQKLVCLNYSTPFKSPTKSHRLHQIDFLLETSLLAANVHSSEYGIKLDNCFPLGFPRNDTILCSTKRATVEKWIKTMTDAEYDKIILYVPTYRDYKGAYSSSKSVLGLGSQEELTELLNIENALLITKFHPLQDITAFEYNDRIIEFEKTYDFTVYDLLSIVDVLISDYSSILHDYMVLNRPIIHDFFDRDKYDETRGFAFDPVDNACPGAIATDWNELLLETQKSLHGEMNYDRYYFIKNLFHKYNNGFTERVFESLKENIL